MSDRTRWPGVHLGDNERDRVIAVWLDTTAKEQHINVSEAVKDFLYALATGLVNDPTAQAVIDVLRPELVRMREMLARGVTVQGTSADTIVGNDDTNEIERRLAGLPD